VAGSASLAVVEGATPLRPELALLEEMLEGWARQQRARRLSPSMIAGREQVARRFQEFTGAWPWHWRPEQVERWVSSHAWAHSTVRNYEGTLAMFMAYLLDDRYGWAEVCRRRVGAVPAQICHEGNSAVHVAEHEGDPRRRPLSREELQEFFDAADERVGKILAGGCKGALPAFRDATLFKVAYAWGLRRREVAMLDVGDFRANPAAPELGRFGVCHVRWGKAMRGSPPRRREVFTLMPWAAEALAQYMEEVRPLYEAPGPELWPTERGGRISTRHVDERFASFRRAAGLPDELSVHCLRHSYITHLIEDGCDPLLVQHQAGHSWASTTAVYTTVGSDYKQRMTRAALERAFGRTEPENPWPDEPRGGGRVTAKTKAKEVGYRWHLRMKMAEAGMFATSDLLPLLAARGVVLSREQVYRLVARVPERLSLKTLAALCDIFDCQPGGLVEPTRGGPSPRPKPAGGDVGSKLSGLQPRRAQILPGPKRK